MRPPGCIRRMSRTGARVPPKLITTSWRTLSRKDMAASLRSMGSMAFAEPRGALSGPVRSTWPFPASRVLETEDLDAAGGADDLDCPGDVGGAVVSAADGPAAVP